MTEDMVAMVKAFEGIGLIGAMAFLGFLLYRLVDKHYPLFLTTKRELAAALQGFAQQIAANTEAVQETRDTVVQAVRGCQKEQAKTRETILKASALGNESEQSS